jgi:hypothetical protein
MEHKEMLDFVTESEVYQVHKVFGDPKHSLYCSIGGMGAGVANVEETVMELQKKMDSLL